MFQSFQRACDVVQREHRAVRKLTAIVSSELELLLIAVITCGRASAGGAEVGGQRRCGTRWPAVLDAIHGS